MSTNQRSLAGLARSQFAQEPSGSSIPVPKPRWLPRVVLPTMLIVVTSGLMAYAGREALWPETPVTVVPVILKQNAKANTAGEIVVQAPGWVEADPFPMAASVLADGVVEEVLVLEGDRVQEGQVIARLVDDDARIAVKQAKASLHEQHALLDVAKARLEEATRNWDHPIELTRKLRTAEAKHEEVKAELERWPHRLARIEAEAVYLEKELLRVEPLVAGGSANEIEVIKAQQDYRAKLAERDVVLGQKKVLEAHVQEWEAEVDAARENLELRIADSRAVAEAAADVERAKASVETAEAVLDDAQLQLDRMEVRSPQDGIVMVRLAEPGAKLMLHMDNPYSAQVVRLYDPERLQVRVDVPLVDAAKVGVGQKAEVIVDVLPDRVYKGHISRVVHEADVQKNTLQVKVAIENPTPELKPEMLARARFLGRIEPMEDDDDQAGRIFVPRNAIQKDGEATYVWVADQVERQARRVSVTVGQRAFDGWTSIREGLQPGDRVIPDPPIELTDGQRIRLLED